jgi:hypothetical protein
MTAHVSPAFAIKTPAVRDDARGMAWRTALGVVLCWAVAARAQGDALFAPPPSRAWQIITERPEAPDDAERALGLRASTARHYTRARGAVSEVCTVELWSFAAPAQAERARAEIAQPTWWGRAAGAQLVLAHGVRLERGRGSRNELSPECTALGEAAHARALATLRRAD